MDRLPLEVTNSCAANAIVVPALGSEQIPELSVVMVAFGTGDVIAKAIQAIIDHTEVSFELIVVDNPPEDGRTLTRHLLRELTSGVRLLLPDCNLGFGQGNNAAVAVARGRYVALVNPDLFATPGWYQPLRDALSDPDVVVAAPVLVYEDGSLQEAGQVIYDTGHSAAFGGPELISGALSPVFSRDVDYASAACWLISRRDYLAIEGFDAAYYPAFFEDPDFALRQELRGFRTRLIADVPVIHLHGMGGAGKGFSAEAQHAIFVSRWHRRLRLQPPRPRSDLEAFTNRDRLVAKHRTITLGKTDSDAESEDKAVIGKIESAIDLARSCPRDRVTLIADQKIWDQVEAWSPELLRRAGSVGLEVLIGDEEHLLRYRRAQLRILRRWRRSSRVRSYQSLWPGQRTRS